MAAERSHQSPINPAPTPEGEQSRYQSMPLTRLAQELARAEYADRYRPTADRMVTFDRISDVIFDRVAEGEAVLQARLDKHVGKIGITPERRQIITESFLDRILSRVEETRDEEFARLEQAEHDRSQVSRQPRTRSKGSTTSTLSFKRSYPPKPDSTQLPFKSEDGDGDNENLTKREGPHSSTSIQPRTRSRNARTTASAFRKTRRTQPDVVVDQSPPSPEPEEQRNSPPIGSSTRRHEGYKFDHERYGYYAAGEDEKVQLAIMVDEENTTLDLHRHLYTNNREDRRILVTDIMGNQYFVSNGSIFDITDCYEKGRLINGKNWRKAGNLEPITIGKRWQWADGLKTEYPVRRVEIATGKADRDSVLYRGNWGRDPFELHKRVLFALAEQSQAARPQPRGKQDLVKERADWNERVAELMKRTGLGEARRALWAEFLGTLPEEDAQEDGVDPAEKIINSGRRTRAVR